LAEWPCRSCASDRVTACLWLAVEGTHVLHQCLPTTLLDMHACNAITSFEIYGYDLHESLCQNNTKETPDLVTQKENTSLI
jgi:hypothetical protein